MLPIIKKSVLIQCSIYTIIAFFIGFFSAAVFDFFVPKKDDTGSLYAAKKEKRSQSHPGWKNNEDAITPIVENSASSLSLTPTPVSEVQVTITPTVTNPSITPSSVSTPVNTQSSWGIRSVSSMKETKDRICNPRPREFIEKWVDTARELGVNYVAVETPYDNPSCGSAVEYTKVWIEVIRSRGLLVWHRHMPNAFEGIYDTAKANNTDYLDMIEQYIKSNPTLFAAGDIFTPIPEPQNGGIQGVTHCASSICQFTGASAFNSWLRNAITRSRDAFSSLGLTGSIKVGYYGFDGFVAWGHNNPDWDGILEDATIAAMGNITIDHYPELVGTSMEQDLAELQARYPNTPVIIGEWGTVTGGNTEQTVLTAMKAAKRPGVIGFNYWHMGVGGNEGLINEDFTRNAQFDEVKSAFSN